MNYAGTPDEWRSLATAIESGTLDPDFIENPEIFLRKLKSGAQGCVLGTALVGRFGIARAVELKEARESSTFDFFAEHLGVSEELCNQVSSIHIDGLTARQIAERLWAATARAKRESAVAVVWSHTSTTEGACR